MPRGDDEILLEHAGSGTADPRYRHLDERGSDIAWSDASGAMAAISAYDEYGMPASTNPGRFQYTGQMWLPEIGVYNYKGRIYSPTLGRFLQTDPIGYGDGMNWYAYVGNDPVNGSDPDGLGTVQVCYTAYKGVSVTVGQPSPGPSYTLVGYQKCEWVYVPDGPTVTIPLNPTLNTTTGTGGPITLPPITPPQPTPKPRPRPRPRPNPRPAPPPPPRYPRDYRDMSWGQLGCLAFVYLLGPKPSETGGDIPEPEDDLRDRADVICNTNLGGNNPPAQ